MGRSTLQVDWLARDIQGLAVADENQVPALNGDFDSRLAHSRHFRAQDQSLRRGFNIHQGSRVDFTGWASGRLQALIRIRNNIVHGKVSFASRDVMTPPRENAACSLTETAICLGLASSAFGSKT